MRTPMLPRALFFVMLLSVPAVASPTTDEADALDAKGKLAARSDHAAEACELFGRAYRLDPTPARRWRLAVEELAADRPLAALADLRLYADDPKATDQHKEQARALIEEAYRRTAHLRVHLPEESCLYVDSSETCDPNGSEATREIDVMPGDHTLRASGTTTTVAALVGQVVDVTIEPAVAEPAELPPIVPVSPASSTTVAPPAPGADLVRPRSTKWPVVASVGAGAAAAFGGGVAFALLSQHYSHEGAAMRATLEPGVCSNRQAAGCQVLSNEIHSANTAFIASWALYGTAGALALTTTAMALFWPSHKAPNDRPTAASVLPLIGPGTVGLIGTF